MTTAAAIHVNFRQYLTDVGLNQIAADTNTAGPKQGVMHIGQTVIPGMEAQIARVKWNVAVFQGWLLLRL